MRRFVERCFGNSLPSLVEWLTDNGSAYRAHETRAFAREIGLEPTEQRYSGELREGNDVRLYQYDAKNI